MFSHFNRFENIMENETFAPKEQMFAPEEQMFHFS